MLCVAVSADEGLHTAYSHVCAHFCQVRDGLATAAEMEAISFAWRSWAAEPNGVFYYTNGQAIATVVK